jgi:hypothetical protein
MQLARRAFSRARAKTGKSIDAKIEIIAMTTKSSIRVNACGVRFKDVFFARAGADSGCK